MEMLLNEAIIQLQKYIESENFKGYDPYDTLNSWIPFHWFGKYGQFAAIQIQKRNPVNIRPLIGIQKDAIPKAYALFLHAYSLLYQISKKSEYKENMDFFFNWFKTNKLNGYKGYCWSKNFALTNVDSQRPKVDPSSVLAAFVGEAMFEYHNATKNPEAIDMINGICAFIINHVPVYKTGDNYCYSYTTTHQDFVHNANLHVAELFAKAYSLTKKEIYKDNAIKATNFTVKQQKGDGSWSYRIYPDGSEKMQIDFHQGFILNSIYFVNKYIGNNNTYLNSINKGAEFYKKKQFNNDGSSIYRFPKKYPIDIHNQAQGIITFSLLKDLNTEYLPFAEKIAEWTIKNMQNKKEGYFYYKKYPYFTNKIPYIRWNQAWAFLSLSYLLYTKNFN